MMQRLLVLALCAACTESTTPPAHANGAPLAATPTAAPGAIAAAPAALGKYDPSPAIDLEANRYRFHRYTSEGLLITLATPGYAKYSQEYSQPWRPPVTVDGKSGRVLSARAASLRFPWDGGTDGASLRLYVHGAAAGQRVTVRVNAKHHNVSLEAGWQVAVVPLAAGTLRAGENEIGLIVSKRGTVGGAATYGLWNAIEVVAGAAAALPAGAQWPETEALRGPRLGIPLEIPATAALAVGTHAPAGTRLVVTARPVYGKARTLLDVKATDAAAEHVIPLVQEADHLVWLELRAEGPGAASASWKSPRVLLEKATVRPRPPAVDNVILVVVDALRSDRVPLNGKTRVRMPNLVAAAEAGGVWFPHNQAASPSSPPSHGSIQTGMIPRVHGVSGDKGQLLPGVPTISTVLGDAGVATGYFGNNPFGMGRHQKHGRWTSFHQPGMEGKRNDCETLVKMMLDFAREQHGAGKRFFISSLPYEPHTPYLYNPGITEKYYEGPFDPPFGKSIDGGVLESIVSGKLPMNDQRWAHLKGLYDGEVEKTDVCIGQLLAGLRELGVSEKTAVVITSDHGEGLFEHGFMGHAYGNWRELGDVPLVILGPGLTGGAGRAIDLVSSHLDIAPTIIDLMGVKPPAAMQGASLLPVVQRQGPWTPRVVSLEYGRSYGLRSRRWKMVVGYDQKDQIFDLEKDPTEQKDLAGSPEAALATRYLRDVAGFFLAHRNAWKAHTHGPLNDHTKPFVDHARKQ